MNKNSEIFTKGRKSNLKVLKSFVLIFFIVLNSLIFGFSTVGAETEDLTKDITAKELVKVPILPQKFISATQDFSFDLFRQSVDLEKNSLVSPTSVALAMGMTSNGSDGRTLEQFLQLLGKGQFSTKQLNYYYYVMSSMLQNELSDSVNGNAVRLANSIWYRDDLRVNRDFLQTNADYYKADIFKADFYSPDAVTDINKWVYKNTDGLIDKIIEEISGDSIMFLINTLLFEAEWKTQFDKYEAINSSFKLSNGNIIEGIFFNSSKETYLKNDIATGFIKPYKGGKYSFVAMLPNEKISIQECIKNLDSKSFQSFIDSGNGGKAVGVCVPKFEYSFDVKLVEPLKSLGFVDAFDDSMANFSKMATPYEGIYIKDILHKTYIQLSEVGTKAGAVTKVEMAEKSSPPVENRVILNRPFVYAIVENGTKLPIFIGTVMNPFEN